MTRAFFLLAMSLAIGGGVVAVACSDDGEARVGFQNNEPDSQASLPPASNDDGGAPPGDAAIDPDARGPYNPADEPVTCNTLPCAVEIAGGEHHFCARLNDGTVRCWGDNEYGQLGSFNDAGVDSGVGDGGVLARRVTGLGGVTQISASDSTTCARVEDGGIRCWGSNQHAELGLNATTPTADDLPHPIPRPVALGAGATASRVDVGHGSVCALLSTGKMSCWGKDDQMQLARTGGDLGPDPVNPVRAPGLAELDSVTAGFSTIQSGSFTLLGTSTTGEVWTWGALAGDEGTISGRVSSVSPDRRPRRLAALVGKKVINLSASSTYEMEEEGGGGPGPGPGIPGPDPVKLPPRAHACALANGEVYCWGRSYAGALCTGLPDSSQEPAHSPIVAKTWPQQISVADEISCARMTDGSIYCCGSDLLGRIGKGSNYKKGLFEPFFTKATAFTGNAVKVATSKSAVCALTKSGTVECWGSNEKGELGRVRDEDPHPSPILINF